MRSIEEIQQSMLAALAKANSPADDLSPGSVLSALIRAASSVILEQDNKLSDILETFDLNSLSGSYLDDYALSYFNLRRKPGSLSRGTLILSTESSIPIQIPSGTIFTELNNGLQFITSSAGPVTVDSAFDATVSVLSIGQDTQYNLSAGTLLYSDSVEQGLQRIQAVVGFERTPEGKVCGAISGGSRREDDGSFRRRIQEFRDGLGPSVETSLSSYLPINRAWIKTVAPGFIQIYVDTDSELTDSFRENLTTLVTPFLPPGVAAVFERASIRPIDISIHATPYANTSPDLDIRQALTSYLESFEPGQVIHPRAIQSLIAPYVASMYVESPATSIQLRPGQLPRLGEVSVCYE